MKTTLFIISLFISVSSSFSQTINAFDDCGLTYIYDAAGNRTARLWIPCNTGSHKTDETEQTSVNPSKQDTLLTEIQLNVYPNPTGGKFVLDFNQYLENINFVIVNASGQTIRQQKTSSKQIPVDISALAAGTYYLKIYTAKKNFQSVVVKQ